MSMLILLPKKIDGIQELEKKLVGVNVFEILNDMRNNEVILSFPKFKLEQSMDLNSVLSKVCILIFQLFIESFSMPMGNINFVLILINQFSFSKPSNFILFVFVMVDI